MDEEAGVITGPMIAAYDLTPPPPLMPPFTPLLDALRDGPRPQRPVYVPGPLADGMARVVLTEGEPYDGPSATSFYAYAGPDPRSTHYPEDVFDVPAGQAARWQAATDAYEAAVEEMDALIEARRAADRLQTDGPREPTRGSCPVAGSRRAGAAGTYVSGGGLRGRNTQPEGAGAEAVTGVPQNPQ